MPKTSSAKVGPFAIRPRVRDGSKIVSWSLDVPPHLSPTGKRKRHSFQTKSVAEAEAKRLLNELRLEGAIRGHGPRSAGITFAEIAKRWLEDQGDRVATGRKRQATLVTDAYKLKALLRRLAAFDIANITSKDVVEYQKYRVTSGCAPQTINGRNCNPPLGPQMVRREAVARTHSES